MSFLAASLLVLVKFPLLKPSKLVSIFPYQLSVTDFSLQCRQIFSVGEKVSIFYSSVHFVVMTVVKRYCFSLKSVLIRVLCNDNCPERCLQLSRPLNGSLIVRTLLFIQSGSSFNNELILIYGVLRN